MLRHDQGGPGYKVGGQSPGSKGLNTMIEASRDQGMTQVVTNHIELMTQVSVAGLSSLLLHDF